MSKTKKIIIMSGLVLLLAVTAVFNFVLADTVSGSAAGGEVTAANYFSTYRTERTTTRNEEILSRKDGVTQLYEQFRQRLR